MLSQRMTRRIFLAATSASLASPAAGLEARSDQSRQPRSGPPDRAGDRAYPPDGEPFPGRAGNPVGFAAAPRFPGHLMPWPGGSFQDGTSQKPTVYSFFDFDAGKHGTRVNGSHIKFVGCRFQSNSLDDFNVQCDSAKEVSFHYCSFTPRATLYNRPPGGSWPSAAAGAQTIKQVRNVNCIDGRSAYQYGLNIQGIGPILVDHCDFWGFGNGGPLFYSTTAQIMVRDCWIHDACDEDPQGYHIDGTGYVNGGTPPSHITIDHCTIASLGNTNALAFQTATSPYHHILVTRNYFSGFGICVDMCHGVSGSNNLRFEGNTFGTDIPWKYFPVYGNPTVLFSRANPTNIWKGNRLRVLPGTSPIVEAGFVWVAAQDGYFIWPNNTLHRVDYAG